MRETGRVFYRAHSIRARVPGCVPVVRAFKRASKAGDRTEKTTADDPDDATVAADSIAVHAPSSPPRRHEPLFPACQKQDFTDNNRERGAGANASTPCIRLAVSNNTLCTF